MEVRVAFEHHAAVRVVAGQHERSGADRVPVERQVLPGHSRHAVEAVDLARHRRKERHRQPVGKLRILAAQLDAVAVAVEAADAGQRKAVEIEPGAGRQLLVCLAQRATKFAQADDALAHHAEDRRMQARMRQALDLVDVVVGNQLAAAGHGKVGDGIDAVQLPGVEVAIDRLTLAVRGKRRMRLVADARTNANVVDAARDLRCRCIGWQLAPLGIVVARHRHALAGRRNQRVRSLQIVVLQRRLVDLRSEGDLVLAVRLHRIEVLRTIGERRIEDVLAALGLRIGIVLFAGASREHEQQRQQGEAREAHGRKSTAKCNRFGRGERHSAAFTGTRAAPLAPGTLAGGRARNSFIMPRLN